MPVRMVDDNDDNSSFDDNNPGNGGSGRGGGGGLFNLLPLLLGLFRSKLGIAVLLLGGAAYFFLGQKGCGNFSQTLQNFATGGRLDPKEYVKAPVYEGLADDDTKNPLPEAVSLLKFAPSAGNQGQQGSCVAWSSAYGARTIIEAISKGINPNATSFSPSFLYNQIGLDNCQGSYIIRAMESMQKVGALPLTEFQYAETDCSRQPDGSQIQAAANFKIHSFSRLTTSEDNMGIRINSIKEHLAKDAPVVIGMMVGGSFMQAMQGQQVWHPTADDENQIGFGGHALCVIGYDDRLEGGALQILNSWGADWGQNGVAWVRYADVKNFVREAYGIDPMPKQTAALKQTLDCEVGLVQKKDKQYIPLQKQSNNVFTSAIVNKGTTFKVEVKNNTECYVYVFGQETDGSSYTLFPYPSKTDETKTAYTAYCGVTGYRLFPKSKMLQLDSVGNKDFIAVVVSNVELDWYKLNQQISKGGSAYTENVARALVANGHNVGQINTSNTSSGTIRFEAASAQKFVSYAIVEINKQ